MNIWLLQASEPLPIINKGERLLRMGMIAEELNKRGHKITWFANTFDHFQKKQLYDKDTIVKINDNYSVYLLHAIGYKRNISISRIINHKIIAKKFRKISKKLNKPDLIYVSFPTIDYAEEAVKYGRENNIPVIVDIRDLWPDIFYHNLPKVLSIMATPYIKWMNHKTKRIMKNAFAINAVSEAVLDWGLKKGNKQKSKFDQYFYIGYDRKELEQQPIEDKTTNKIDENKFNISFFGTINNQFDYDRIVELAKLLEEKNQDIMINICGDGPQFKELEKKTENISNIQLLGWIGKDKLTYILQNSKIGLAPYKNTFDFQMGVSNKFAEYISYGLPIVLTSEGYMKKLLEEKECGISTRYMEEMADFIIELKANPEKYEEMSKNAINLYKEKFVAEKIYKELVDYLEKIKEERKMKYALIGCGRIAPNHLEAAVDNKLEVVGICDIVPEHMDILLEKLELQNEGFTKYTDYHEMLEKEKPELVAIATESGEHAKIAIDCLEAGCHLIIEKPIALSLEDADKIIAKSKEKGLVVCANHQNRFNKSIQRIRKAVENGELGKMMYGTAHIRWNRGQDYYTQAPWRGTWAQDGGALMNQCIHNIDLLRWMMGDEVEEVCAYTDNLNHDYIQAEDLGIAIVKFKNGSYGIIEGTTDVYPKNLEETLYLFGQKGTVKAGGKSVNIIEEWILENQEESAEEIKEKNSEMPKNIYGFGHTPLYEDVIKAIKTNTKPLVDAEAGKRALEMVLAIYKSAAEGRPIKLPLDRCSTMDFVGRFDK